VIENWTRGFFGARYRIEKVLRQERKTRRHMRQIPLEKRPSMGYATTPMPELRTARQGPWEKQLGRAKLVAKSVLLNWAFCRKFQLINPANDCGILAGN